MPISITINDQEVRSSIRRVTEHLRGTRSLHESLARSVRDYAKDTIRLQGRSKPFAPLSPWTRRQNHGRTKALLPFIPLIRARWSAVVAEVYVEQPEAHWHPNDHIRGWYVPAHVSRRVMRVPVRMGKAIYFRSRAGYKVPGRPFWPTTSEAQAVMRPIVFSWLKEAERKWGR